MIPISESNFLDTLRRDERGRIVYTYRGSIERGHDYHRIPGYSATTKEGHVLYPWNTKREIWADAKRQGVKVAFEESEVKFAS